MVLVSEGKNSGHRGLESEQLNIMASTEKLCLRWNDFESNISSAFRDLKEDKDFSDVTLACSDQQVEAHKVILAASSNFFKKVLKNVQHSHPLIYMKGVKFTDLEAVLNFVYHGEVNVAEADPEVNISSYPATDVADYFFFVVQKY